MRKGSGFGMGVVVSILLLVVGIVLFFPFIEQLFGFITSSGNAASCKFSLISGTSPDSCLEQVKISVDKVELNDKTFLQKGAGDTQNMAKEAMTKLLALCLSKGGGYNSRAFSESNFQKQAVCAECYKITFDEKVGVVKDLTSYLRDTKVKGALQEKTYLQMLTKDEGHLKAYMEYGMGFGLAPSNGAFEFKPDQEYTVFFIGLKKGYFPKIASQAWNIITLDFFKLFFGNQDTYFTYVAESYKLRDVCDIKVN